jgi:hypothetical protein
VKISDKVIDHFDNLTESHLASMHRHLNEVKAWIGFAA